MDISKYVQWPEEVMESSEYFTIGVLTNKEDLFYELDAIAKNRKTIQGKEIRLLFFREINMIEPTRVLYVNNNEDYKSEKVLDKIKAKHTLLMG